MDEELQRLILRGENDAVDFKQRINQPEKIARTLVSFANTRGGVLLVGVKDNGTISGVDPEEEKHTLQQAADFYCDPPVQLLYEEIEEDKRTVLKVIIPESSTKPHFAKVKEDDWRGYVRVKDTSVQTSKMVNKVLAQEEEEQNQLERLPLDRHEHSVLDYLEKNPRITLRQYMKLGNLSERRAYRILVKLVLHGYLRLHDKEKEYYYTLS
ncbi:putative DNA-binding protein [Pontibacter ummariensis]|uniref:Putative DNA-binding domain-containing protein n=1 Tax=Pontibacter ummariensis TaxID=1610492 RepID=A0A239FLZ4_9BACT|nr:ATP-binding protein [Pontibacter ummariensis]PRY12015.1 putative DNA-binding protein [Pontibacter ummariensis]SNS57827.1 Putative DNA-binding domain-containing protein [Pontibacter ummariensis]